MKFCWGIVEVNRVSRRAGTMRAHEFCGIFFRARTKYYTGTWCHEVDIITYNNLLVFQRYNGCFGGSFSFEDPRQTQMQWLAKEKYSSTSIAARDICRMHASTVDSHRKA